MPSKSAPFTPSSILFRPRIRKQWSEAGRREDGQASASRSLAIDHCPLMVEAPGTAPGSEWFITTAVYRHSRQAGTPNIGANGPRRKSRLPRPVWCLCKCRPAGVEMLVGPPASPGGSRIVSPVKCSPRPRCRHDRMSFSLPCWDILSRGPGCRGKGGDLRSGRFSWPGGMPQVRSAFARRAGASHARPAGAGDDRT